MSNSETLIAGIFGLLLGSIGLATGFVQLRNRARFGRWQKTEGKVVERGTYEPSIPMSGPPAFRHAPLIRYEYHVNDQTFVSDAIHPRRIQLPQHNTLKWAQKRAASFPDTVSVQYNPEDPGESYLVLTSKLTLFAVVIASCCAMLFGLLLLLAWSFK
jgi:hypothetical protein